MSLSSSIVIFALHKLDSVFLNVAFLRHKSQNHLKSKDVCADSCVVRGQKDQVISLEILAMLLPTISDMIFFLKKVLTAINQSHQKIENNQNVIPLH